MATKQTPKVIDFDAKRKKSGPTVRAKIKAFGKEWKLIRPNSMLAGRLVDHEGDMQPGYVNDYLLAHIHPNEREEFTTAALQADDLDLEMLMDLMAMMTEAVYDQVPSEPS